MAHFDSYISQIMLWPIYLLPLGVLILSIIGSPHCLAMCGVLASGVNRDSKKSTVLYHMGRLFIYIFLGAAAGALGGELLKDIQKPVFLIAAIPLALLYILSSLRILGLRFGSNLISFFSPYTTLMKKIQPFGTKSRSLLLGCISGLLPCGWLYTIVLATTAVQNYFLGILILAFFWLGTIPIFTFAPLVFRSIKNIEASFLRKSLRISIALLFFTLGSNLLWVRAHQLFSDKKNESIFWKCN